MTKTVLKTTSNAIFNMQKQPSRGALRKSEVKSYFFINKISSEKELAPDSADLTLEYFKTGTTVNLKAFLQFGGKNSEGVRNYLLPKFFLLDAIECKP